MPIIDPSIAISLVGLAIAGFFGFLGTVSVVVSSLSAYRSTVNAIDKRIHSKDTRDMILSMVDTTIESPDFRDRIVSMVISDVEAKRYAGISDTFRGVSENTSLVSRV